MALITARDLGCAQRLQGVDLDLRAGEMLGVVGPNGAGKSTLLHCLAGLLPHAGTLALEGRALARMAPAERGRAIGLMPQFCDSAWALRVDEVVALGRLPWMDRDAGAVGQAMQETGVQHLAARRVDTLSGGERARVWLARVLAGRPRLLLADEPVASLDLYHQRAVMHTLARGAAGGQAVVLAIHDLALAARHCHRICLLEAGRVRALGTPAEVLTEPLLSAVFRVPVRVDLQAEPPVVAVK